MIFDNVLKIMDNIFYGWTDIERKIYKDDFSSFSSNYVLQTPSELLESKNGVCWDQVELERKLFDDNNVLNETYFIFIDDGANLPSHTFIVVYLFDKVYWFEHSWYDERGVHEYNNITELLNDVEVKFNKSRESEVAPNLITYIYKYDKPKFHITCDEFYNYIYTQKRIYNYYLCDSNSSDLDRLKEYKLNTIGEYANDISDSELTEIKSYVDSSVIKWLSNYKNIVLNNEIIGCLLVRPIDNGILIDEIYIDDLYRNKSIGTSIITNIINSNKNIYLWVYKENCKAINLYKKLGFNIVSETDSRYYMYHK